MYMMYEYCHTCTHYAIQLQNTLYCKRVVPIKFSEPNKFERT